MRYLLLRLEGPLLAFGTVAIDDSLPTGRFPARSMISGLLANAAGMLRTDSDMIQELQDNIEIASRLDRPGTLLDDYQTAQIDFDEVSWTSSGRLARRKGEQRGIGTVQLRKQYWMDSSVTVAVSMPNAWIDRYVQALNKPARPLFLGRKSCAPTRPIYLDVIEADDLVQALERCPMDNGGSAILRGQWPDRIKNRNAYRSEFVSDVKEWRNRVHTGGRDVFEGNIIVEAVPS